MLRLRRTAAKIPFDLRAENAIFPAAPTTTLRIQRNSGNLPVGR